MSTDRVEIKPDNNEKSLEQSAEELKNVGVDVSKDVAVNANGETAKLTEIKEEVQTTEERPDWLPEKFKSAEDLAKAYGDLEKQFSSRPKEEAKPKEAVQETAKEGLDKFYNEFAETGELTEKSYEELAKKGLDKSLVDSYIQGQKSVADAQTKTIQDIAGGKDQYSELVEWAGKNLTEAEQTTFNNMVDGGDIEQAKFAVQGLMTRAGANPKQPSLFEGTSDVVSKDAFTSVSQVTDAMNDPRYEKDPAYRKEVADKIGRSTVI
ncbi:hypothetical protein OAK00_02695 [Pelagibacteraceae bacterium]|nr:hypothetical protein [Pelagibacteraceae bacterium]|tara:strand:+ start:947 stop:1741 length:795 start_codon:yes stop_codon:yes gene_type:complete